jgi:hypothetical protein
VCDDDTIDEAVVDIQLPTDKAEAWKKEEKAVFQREAAVSAASLGDELSSLGDRMMGRPPGSSRLSRP